MTTVQKMWLECHLEAESWSVRFQLPLADSLPVARLSKQRQACWSLSNALQKTTAEDCTARIISCCCVFFYKRKLFFCSTESLSCSEVGQRASCFPYFSLWYFSTADFRCIFQIGKNTICTPMEA